MMLGWTLETTKLAPVTVPVRRWVTNAVHARFLAPFRGGAFVATRDEQLPHTEDWTSVGYFLDPQEEKLHRITVPEIRQITSALTIGDAAWFAGKTQKGNPLLLKVDGSHRQTVPLPPGQSEPPELGIDGRSLLLVYPHVVFREQAAEGWEMIYDGELTWRRSGPPPRLFGSRLYLRDEGRGESGKQLTWLDLAAPPRLGSLQAEMESINSVGASDNTSSYCITSGGDLWATLGEDFAPGEEMARESVVRRARDGSCQIGILHSCLQFDPAMVNGDGGALPPGIVDISGLYAQGDELMLVGNHGLYQLVDRTLVQLVGFASTVQEIPIQVRGKKLTFHWSWDPSNLLPLGKDRWLISATFGGIYILERKPDQEYELRCLDDPLGKDVGF